MVITKEEMIKLNWTIIQASGGEFGFLKEGDLDFAIDMSNSALQGDKAAAALLYYGLIGHPFVNGNKRTIYQTAQEVMASAGSSLVADYEKIVGFTGSIASGLLDKAHIRLWINNNVYLGSVF